MKKYCISVILSVIAFSAQLEAASGSAIITSWEVIKAGSGSTNNEILFHVCLSNITDDPVTVKIPLITGVDSSGGPTYYLDGDNNPSTGKITAYGSFSDYAESPSGGSVSFTIPAQKTMKIVVNPGTTVNAISYFGYGRVEWTSSSNSAFALIGNVRLQHNEPGSHISVTLLNDGKPF